MCADAKIASLRKKTINFIGPKPKEFDFTTQSTVSFGVENQAHFHPHFFSFRPQTPFFFLPEKNSQKVLAALSARSLQQSASLSLSKKFLRLLKIS
jgi:hypothetical protein